MADEQQHPHSRGRELTQFLSYRIARLHQELNAQAVAILDVVAGISQPQWRVLSMIGSGTATAARDISRQSGMDPAMISRTSQALETAGLIETSRPDSDRRVLHMQLTGQGRELYNRTLPHMQTRQEALLSALQPEEREIVFEILDKLERAAERREFPR